MVLKHTIVSTVPYLFNLLYFVGLFTITLLHSLHLKCIIQFILKVLLFILFSPGPYLFNIFYLVVFYIDSTSCFTSKMNNLYYLDSPAIYFLSPVPYPFNLFCFVDSTSSNQTKMSYPIYPESASIYFLISRTLSIQYFLPSCLLH